MTEGQWEERLMRRPSNFAAHVDHGQYVTRAPVSVLPDGSGPLAVSNHRVMVNRLREFGDDVVETTERHWALGLVEALYVQVRRDGEFTPAWRVSCLLLDLASDYPVLDEEDLAAAEMEHLEETVAGCLSDLTDGHEVGDEFAERLVCEYVDEGGEMAEPQFGLLLSIAERIRAGLGHGGDWMDCESCNLTNRGT